jgi:hypothetical protein
MPKGTLTACGLPPPENASIPVTVGIFTQRRESLTDNDIVIGGSIQGPGPSAVQCRRVYGRGSPGVGEGLFVHAVLGSAQGDFVILTGAIRPFCLITDPVYPQTPGGEIRGKI